MKPTRGRLDVVAVTGEWPEGFVMRRFPVRLVGTGLDARHVPGPWLGELLVVLAEGARRAVRLRLEGRGAAPGAAPEWLQRAADFRLHSIRTGSVRLLLEAPTLAEACPERFGQGTLFEDSSQPFVGRSGLELFEESVAEIMAGDADGDLYDDGLLETVERFDTVLGGAPGARPSGGLDRIELGRGGRTRVDREGVGRARELHDRVPAEQRVLITGRLETIRHSDRMFTLLLASGEKVRGFLLEAADGVDHLRDLWGLPALVQGTARYKPSGNLARLEADRIRAAAPGDEAFERLPGSAAAPLADRSLRRPQSRRSGIGAMIGQWPGDESDDEVFEALRQLS
jgi:hypothetical protein